MITRLFLAFSLFLIPISTICQSSNKLTNEKWIEDFIALKEKLPQSHINLYHSIDEEFFHKKLDTIINQNYEWNYSKSFVEISKLLAKIGDGHTFARVPNRFNRFPMQWFWFSDGLRLTKTNAGNKKFLGMKLVSIDNKDLKEIQSKLFEMSTDNEGDLYQYFFSTYFLSIPEVLYGLGITNSIKKAAFEFEDENGNKIKKVINALDLKSYSSSIQISAYHPDPLYLNSSQPISFQKLDDSTLYINFQSYPKSIKRISNRIKRIIRKDKIKKLIIDFRLNTGGNFKKGLFLIKKIKLTGFHKYGKTYVLIGRRTISAAMSNTCHFKQKMHATLVGEPTGSRPIGYQENDEFHLPNSKIKISYSTKLYKFLEEDTKGVYPDKEISPNFEALKKGNDPALDWIIRQK